MALTMSAGAAAILICGSVWLAFLLHLDLAQALLIGALPFVAVDALKVLSATSVAYLMTPRRSRPSQG